MKAATYKEYGPAEVIHLKEVEKPRPRDNEVLVRTHTTTVTSADARLRSFTMPLGFGFIGRMIFGFFRPRNPVLGVEIAGEVEAVGANVTNFKVGDRVFGSSDTSMACHAEYKCMAEDSVIALIPPELRYEEAAALPFGGTTALDFLRRANLQRGEKILVNGASGTVGSTVVQLARYFGASVTGVCSSANLDLVRSLGADHVIDYTQEDFARNGEIYDVIVDTVGTAPFSRSKGSLKEGGRLLQVVADLPDMLLIPWVSLTTNKKVIAGPASGRAEDLRFLAELAVAGEFVPVIDRYYSFEKISEAHRYVDGGHKKGTVVITLAHGD